MARPKTGYKLKDGTSAPGVTTILGRFKESGGLLQWAFKQGQQGKPTLYEGRDEAAEIGTHAHNLIEWHLEGEQAERPKPDENMTMSMIARAENAFEQMLQWERISGYYILSWEKPLVSERYRIGGTPDAVFEFEKQIRIGDWKSGKGIYSDAFLQCCAYLLLLEEIAPEWKIEAIDIVRFSKDAQISDHRMINDRKLIELGKRQFLRYLDAYRDDQLIAKHF